MTATRNERADRLDTTLDHAGELDRFLSQANLAVRHSLHVQQFIDESRELIGLSAGDFEGGVDARPIELREGDRHAQSGERVPQLVAEHAEELILGDVRRSALFVEPRVLRLEMQLRPVRADLSRHDRQELQMLFGVRGWRLPPDVEQADEVEPDDGECQVEAVRRLSGHLRGERIRVRRGRFAKVAEEPSERLADGLVP